MRTNWLGSDQVLARLLRTLLQYAEHAHEGLRLAPGVVMSPEQHHARPTEMAGSCFEGMRGKAIGF